MTLRGQKTTARRENWYISLATIVGLGMYPAAAKSEPSVQLTLSADSLTANGCVYNRPIGQGVVALDCNGSIYGTVNFPPGNGSYQISITAAADLVP